MGVFQSFQPQKSTHVHTGYSLKSHTSLQTFNLRLTAVSPEWDHDCSEMDRLQTALTMARLQLWASH